jgi:hypothetical protein
MTKYRVYADYTLELNIEVEADSQELAEQIALNTEIGDWFISSAQLDLVNAEVL